MRPSRSGRRRNRAVGLVVAVLALTGVVACEPVAPGDQDLSINSYIDSRLAVGSTTPVYLSISNKGSGTAHGVKVVVIAPAHLTMSGFSQFDSCTAPRAFGSAGGTIVECTTADLAPSGYKQFWFSLHADSIGPSGDLTMITVADVPEAPGSTPNVITFPVEVSEPWTDLSPQRIGVFDDDYVIGAPIMKGLAWLKNLGPLPAPQFTSTLTWSGGVTISEGYVFGYLDGAFVSYSCSIVGQTMTCAVPAGLGRHVEFQNGLMLIVTLTPVAAGPYSFTHTMTSSAIEPPGNAPNTLVQTGMVTAA